MKASKGKEFIAPDKGWFISESKWRYRNSKSKLKRFLIKTFNRKLRQFYKRKMME